MSRLTTYATALIFSMVAILYVPFSVNLGWELIHSQPSNAQYKLLDNIVGDSYSAPAQGHLSKMSRKGSVLGWLIGNHAIFNGLALGIAALQLLKGLFKIPTTWHRRLGILYSLFFLPGVSLSAAYLVKQGPAETFSGPIFCYALWLLTASSLLTYGLGMTALAKGQLLKHRFWMRYHFAWMFSAPLLRLLWALCGLLFEGDLVINNIATISISPLLISGMMALVLAQMVNTSRPSSSATAPPNHWPIYCSIFLFGIVLFIVLGAKEQALHTQLAPFAFGLFLVITLLFAALYRLSSDLKNVQKNLCYGTYLKLFCLSPLLILIGLPLHGVFLAGTELSLVGSMVTTWGLGFAFCAYIVVQRNSVHH